MKRKKQFSKEELDKYLFYQSIYRYFIRSNIDFNDYIRENKFEPEIESKLTDIVFGRYLDMDITDLELIHDKVQEIARKTVSDDGYIRYLIYGTDHCLRFPCPPNADIGEFLEMFTTRIYEFRDNDPQNNFAHIYSINTTHDAWIIDWVIGGYETVDFVITSIEQFKNWFRFFNEIFPNHRKYNEED